MGYHSKKINKGMLGEISKIREELEELEDANWQGNKVLELCEGADLVGAIKCWLEKEYPGITIYDLLKMAEATKSAFLDGSRR